jgi:hypothetical protein
MRSDDKKVPVTYFSWLCPDSTMTCWQKIHKYYEPRKVYSMTTNAKDDDKEHKYNFSKINTKSELFKAKQLAFGKVTTRRGRPKTDNAGSGKGKKGEAANLTTRLQRLRMASRRKPRKTSMNKMWGYRRSLKGEITMTTAAAVGMSSYSFDWNPNKKKRVAIAAHISTFTLHSTTGKKLLNT